MMSQAHVNLIRAKERVRNRRKLEAMLAEAQGLLGEAERSRDTHHERLGGERADVDKLEGYSLAALFSTVLGTQEEWLEKERQEYLAAKLKHDESVEAVESTRQEVERLRRELTQFQDADAEYDRLVEEKHRLLVESRDGRGEALLGLAERLADLGADRKELHEAIRAGTAALDALNRVRTELRSAESWGTWDLFGGGFLATMAKHSRIDAARQQARTAQRLLRRFQEELADAGHRLQVALDVDGFSSFADYLFDGLIADWVVQSKVQNASAVCGSAVSKVNETLAECRRRLDAVERECVTAIEQRRQLVEQA